MNSTIKGIAAKVVENFYEHGYLVYLEENLQRNQVDVTVYFEWAGHRMRGDHTVNHEDLFGEQTLRDAIWAAVENGFDFFIKERIVKNARYQMESDSAKISKEKHRDYIKRLENGW
jgi:hypothetical protein